MVSIHASASAVEVEVVLGLKLDVMQALMEEYMQLAFVQQFAHT